MREEWTPPQEFDEYRLTSPLGRGRMGRVYLAFDTMLARQVAVKFVSAVAPGSAARERFLTEARAAARLQHPNVVTVHRVGELEGRPYLVSEFVRGQTLDKLPKPIPWKRVLEISLGLARGLAAAHRKGVLHRDIKPGNAILAEDGSAKLLDFGLAKFEEQAVAPAPESSALSPDGDPAATMPPEAPLGVSDPWVVEAEPLDAEPPSPTQITRVGAILGTPDYMAPESWRGEPATRRSDVYSLGAVLYELCAGTPPYGRVSLRELRTRVQESPHTPLLETAPGTEPGLAAIIERCLSRDPEARFASGDELREAIETLSRTTAGELRVPAGNPYRGLRPFEADHRSLFFGRDDEVGVVLDRLRAEPFVVLAGDSGVGKSSICRAGVVPLVQGRALEGGRTWSPVTLVPGRNPVGAIIEALSAVLPGSAEELSLRLRSSPEGFIQDLRHRLGEGLGLVVFVDQIEELVTQAERSEAIIADAFLGRIAVGVPGLRLLATARADLLTRLASLPALGDEIARGLHLVRPLTPEKMREVIVGPARITGFRFESEELVDTLVESTAHAGGGLPLLQFALTELWEARDRDTGMITQAALDSIGGVAGALARHADSVLAALRPAQRAAARRMLMRLVTLDGTRARRGEGELTGGDPIARAALDALVRSRLVVAHDSEGGSVYEVAHEVLIEGWDTLRGWLHEDADRRTVLDRLARAAGEWERLGRSRDALWSARQLAEASGVGLDELNPAEAAFLDRSRSALRRAKRLRYALILGIPLLLAAALGALELQARHRLAERVGALVAEANTALAEGRAKNTAVEEARRRAFVLFGAGRRDEAQEIWSQATARAQDLDAIYARASQTLESALVLDPSRIDVRDLLGDVLLERALLAERDRRQSLRAELIQRLPLYDASGERRHRWSAPATLAVETNPVGALVGVERYGWNARQQLEASADGDPRKAPFSESLPPGSYRLTLNAPGRATVRYPVLLGRGEELRLRIDLPEEARVPPGYLYVPPGRFLFGTSADEALQRGFFDTVPLHEERTDGFLIARYEVTLAEWLRYLDQLPPEERDRRTPRVGKSGFTGTVRVERPVGGPWRYHLQISRVANAASAGEPIRYAGRHQRAFQDWLRFPVTGVSAEDAQAYAAWLNATRQVPGARLCTEYEWERAARGADDREYPHGSRLEPEDANHDRTYGRHSQGMGPDEVGSHPTTRSPFGVDDMTGNAFEWAVSSLAPGQFVARGGSFFYDAKTNQIPNRMVSLPTLRDGSLGVRICASFQSP